MFEENAYGKHDPHLTGKLYLCVCSNGQKSQQDIMQIARSRLGDSNGEPGRVCSCGSEGCMVDCICRWQICGGRFMSQICAYTLCLVQYFNIWVDIPLHMFLL